MIPVDLDSDSEPEGLIPKERARTEDSSESEPESLTKERAESEECGSDSFATEDSSESEPESLTKERAESRTEEECGSDSFATGDSSEREPEGLTKERAESRTKEECGRDSFTTGGSSEGAMVPDRASHPRSTRQSGSQVATPHLSAGTEIDEWILTHLSKSAAAALGRTDRRWRDTFRQWCASLPSLYFDAPERRVSMALRACPQVRRLHIMNGYHVTDETLEDIAKSCQWLQVLHLNLCAITDQGVRILAAECRQLSRLAITDCQVSISTLHVVASLPLQILKMGNGAREVPARGKDFVPHLEKPISLHVMANIVPSLQRDLLAYCRQDFDGFLAVLDLSGRILIKRLLRGAAALCLSNLQRLSLSACVIMRPALLRPLLASCPRLWSLNISCLRPGSQMTADDIMAVVAKASPELRVVDLSRSPSLTSDGVWTLAAGCPKLRVLDLSFCPNVTRRDHFVLDLSLEGCPLIGDVQDLVVQARRGLSPTWTSCIVMDQEDQQLITGIRYLLKNRARAEAGLAVAVAAAEAVDDSETSSDSN